MRDGTRLTASAWWPSEESGRYPTILLRSPYTRTCCTIPNLATFYTKHGYALVSQEVRGRGDSEGKFGFWFQEVNDGYDTVEWLAAQPWSNGRVCIIGGSYLGSTAWLAARSHPPHLNCIAPASAGGEYFEHLPYLGGSFALWDMLTWINMMTPSSTPGGKIDIKTMVAHRPLVTSDSAVVGRVLPLYRELLAHPTMDAYWKPISFEPADLTSIDLPVLHVTGTYDMASASVLSLWTKMRRFSPARDRQYLILGAWPHELTFFGGNPTADGKLEPPAFENWGSAPQTVMDMRNVYLEFFDRHLKSDGDTKPIPRARVYVTGAEEWREYDDFPPQSVGYRALYLHSNGKANSAAGDGSATWIPPTKENPDRYVFDPRPESKPSPIMDPEDERSSVETRSDILVYTSSVLDASLDVIGPVEAELYVSSDAPDTDFLVSLFDVYPDGRVRGIGAFPGVIRARYRKGFDKEVLMKPSKTERLHVKLAGVAHRFLPGHRLRVEISSSGTPLLSLNQNTGYPAGTDTEWRVAKQTIFHSARTPSHLLLPVVVAH